MTVVDTKDINFDPVWVQRLKEHIDRITTKRTVSSAARFRVTTGGVHYEHRLGSVPVHISIKPLSDMYVWHYKPPDWKQLHLKSNNDGWVLISVSGE